MRIILCIIIIYQTETFYAVVIELCNLFYDGHTHTRKRSELCMEVKWERKPSPKCRLHSYWQWNTLFHYRFCCVSSPLPTTRFMHACKMLCEYGFGKSIVLYGTVRAPSHTAILHLKRVRSHFLPAMSSRLHRTMNILNFALKRPPHRKCILSA